MFRGPAGALTRPPGFADSTRKDLHNKLTQSEPHILLICHQRLGKILTGRQLADGSVIVGPPGKGLQSFEKTRECSDF